MPANLQELMRRETIELTMKLYVRADASRSADVLWEAQEKARVRAVGDTSGAPSKIDAYETSQNTGF